MKKNPTACLSLTICPLLQRPMPTSLKCLRHIAAQYNGADYLYITSVNPARLSCGRESMRMF